MFRAWIGCCVAFAKFYVAMQGVRLAEEVSMSNNQVKVQLSSPSRSGNRSIIKDIGDFITRYCTLPCHEDDSESEGGTDSESESDLESESKDEGDTRKYNAKNYTDVEEIGRGSYGMAYRALDRKTRKVVVIKKLIFLRKSSKEEKRKDKRELAGECMILQWLHNVGNAPGLINCFNSFIGEKEPSIVLEDAGDDVYKHLRKVRETTGARERGAWELTKLTESVRIIQEALKAVEYIASKRVMHRDLKPANIAVKNADVKLIDFGNAIRVDKEAPRLKNDDKLVSLRVYQRYIFAPPEVRDFWGPKHFKDQATMEKKMFVKLEAFDLWSLGMSLLTIICGGGQSERADIENIMGSRLDQGYNEAKFKECFGDHLINDQKSFEKFKRYKALALDMLKALLNPDPAKRSFPPPH
eukprot:TRINITY_DN9011_c0_g2_i1.p1 TRINITY_DN9011_c0_g2~~TRINITY_DN9011_c0_g2_i1.p1  ORF type:complete len:412 (+),score=51.45 TRINITY_DN9011_c0_g2_i1:129-1364(+)